MAMKQCSFFKQKRNAAVPFFVVPFLDSYLPFTTILKCGSLERDLSVSVLFRRIFQQFQTVLFPIYSQQDSQEFLIYLLEGLHEDVNRVLEKKKQMIKEEEGEEKIR